MLFLYFEDPDRSVHGASDQRQCSARPHTAQCVDWLLFHVMHFLTVCAWILVRHLSLSCAKRQALTTPCRHALKSMRPDGSAGVRGEELTRESSEPIGVRLLVKPVIFAIWHLPHSEMSVTRSTDEPPVHHSERLDGVVVLRQ